jgi:hypothetical protein
MHEKALQDCATVLCALSKWEYWHGSKDRSEALNRAAAHVMMFANWGGRKLHEEADFYMKGAERLVSELSRDMLQ